MINWKEISNLHVISKLEEIIHKWFGVELIYVDSYGKIRGPSADGKHEYKSQFLKIQNSVMSYGHEFLSNDIEKIIESFQDGKKTTAEFDSFFESIKMKATSVSIDGDFQGMVMVYPFLKESVVENDLNTLKDKMLECGSSEKDSALSIENLSRLSDQEREYLSELLELVADEIVTFHNEITKREDIIHDLNSELGDKFRYHTMIGKSKKMQKIYHLLEKISKSESSVLIQGDNGTGKELVAKAIHFYSNRKDNIFMAVNCSAFNDNLLDSELFGHVKGSFTGALKDKKGLFESAHGGTLFLDEIGDTSLSMQVKLLRVLQEGTYLPVGATSPKKTDVRIVTATNKDLKLMMANSEFREDLFYRINVINISLPPLKDRMEDIPLLIEHFLKRKCDEAGSAMKVLSKKCLETLLDYSWPGNVRELENEVERLVVLSAHDKIITPDILSPRILDFGPARSSKGFSGRGIKTTGKLKDALEELETLMIREGLKRCNFNKSKLSKELGISRAGLIMKVEKYGLDKRKKAANE